MQINSDTIQAMELRWERRYKEQEARLTQQFNAMLNAKHSHGVDLQAKVLQLEGLADELEKKYASILGSAPPPKRNTISNDQDKESTL